MQKYTIAPRQLAYITSANALDENFRMFERIARENFHTFFKYVMRLYGPRYLHKPTCGDIQKLYVHHKNVHGLSGMLGCNIRFRIVSYFGMTDFYVTSKIFNKF